MKEIFRGCAYSKWLDIIYKYHTGKISESDFLMLWEICIDLPIPKSHNVFTSKELIIKQGLRKYLKEEPYEFLRITSGMKL